eukprot:GHVQ01008464.1.p1 GENE.GHVQ01008464.1~~GHVQ01008464.1.p1  ORF type:complete len:319 (+),score=27.65 GHVQ01008464.1:49-1005(+)
MPLTATMFVSCLHVGNLSVRRGFRSSNKFRFFSTHHRLLKSQLLLLKSVTQNRSGDPMTALNRSTTSYQSHEFSSYLTPPLLEKTEEFFEVLEDIRVLKGLLRETSDKPYSQPKEHSVKKLEHSDAIEQWYANDDDDNIHDQDLVTLEENAAVLEGEIAELLLHSHKNVMKRKEDYTCENTPVFLEVKPGVGGDEACLFARDLFLMYEALSNKQGWEFCTINVTASDVGGYKAGVAKIAGSNAFGLLKHEAGVHRVQRVPQTARNGHVHTSTASIEVVPEPTDNVDGTSFVLYACVRTIKVQASLTMRLLNLFGSLLQ